MGVKDKHCYKICKGKIHGHYWVIRCQENEATAVLASFGTLDEAKSHVKTLEEGATNVLPDKQSETEYPSGISQNQQSR